MMQSSSTVHACRTAQCPTVTRSPTVVPRRPTSRGRRCCPGSRCRRRSGSASDRRARRCRTRSTSRRRSRRRRSPRGLGEEHARADRGVTAAVAYELASRPRRYITSVRDRGPMQRAERVRDQVVARRERGTARRSGGSRRTAVRAAIATVATPRRNGVKPRRTCGRAEREPQRARRSRRTRGACSSLSLQTRSPVASSSSPGISNSTSSVVIPSPATSATRCARGAASAVRGGWQRVHATISSIAARSDARFHTVSARSQLGGVRRHRAVTPAPRRRAARG